MTTGIFGGSFNPPHVGHLIVAESARLSLGLDRILFIPSYIAPHKQEGGPLAPEHRLAMTTLAITGNPSFLCSDLEIRRTDTSYTVDTVEQLLLLYPGDAFTLLIGMDNYQTFHTWREPQRILTMAHLAVLTRPGYERRVNEVIGTKNATFVEVPGIDLASSMIRDQVRQGRSIRYQVSEAVEDYIRTNGLYR